MENDKTVSKPYSEIKEEKYKIAWEKLATAWEEMLCDDKSIDDIDNGHFYSLGNKLELSLNEINRIYSIINEKNITEEELKNNGIIPFEYNWNFFKWK